ncbi:MAG: rRNA maturation RNase YbeY [Patescibacteria group bacterium]|nr:rRNA maturation RNase YbeY [Patescibacteria group bacterium]
MLEIRNFTQNEIDENFFKKITEIVLKEVDAKDKTEISLAIVGDGRMRKLNKMYRGKNRVTDVLSFGDKTVIPYLAKAFPRLKKNKDIEFIDPPDNIKRLGEIIICYPQAKKQAKELNHSLEKELTILLIHGMLHLLGYNHETMKDIENIILKKIKE